MLKHITVYEIAFPGVWLKIDDRAIESRTLEFINLLESQFTDAVVSLHLYDQESEPLRAVDPRERFMHQRRIEDQAQKYVDDEFSGKAWPATDFDRMEVTHRVAVRFGLEEGLLPQMYLQQRSMIAAHGFLYAVNSFRAILWRFTQDADAPACIQEALWQFDEQLSQIRELRNSAQHVEDRGRGLGRNNNEITLQPAQPWGRALVISSIHDDRLQYTLADGSLGELEIKDSSVRVLQSTLQTVVNCFAWKGSPRFLP